MRRASSITRTTSYGSSSPASIAAERARNKEVRDFTMKWFADRGMTPTDSQANFMFVNIGRPAKEFREACAKQGVKVAFDGAEHEAEAALLERPNHFDEKTGGSRLDRRMRRRMTLGAGPQPSRRILDPNPLISKPPSFSPDGKSVLYGIRENGIENLWLQPINDAGPDGGGRRLTNFSADEFRWYNYSPDGKTLAVLRNHSESDVVLLRESSTAAQ